MSKDTSCTKKVMLETKPLVASCEWGTRGSLVLLVSCSSSTVWTFYNLVLLSSMPSQISIVKCIYCRLLPFVCSFSGFTVSLNMLKHLINMCSFFDCSPESSSRAAVGLQCSTVPLPTKLSLLPQSSQRTARARSSLTLPVCIYWSCALFF